MTHPIGKTLFSRQALEFIIFCLLILHHCIIKKKNPGPDGSFPPLGSWVEKRLCETMVGLQPLLRGRWSYLFIILRLGMALLKFTLRNVLVKGTDCYRGILSSSESDVLLFMGTWPSGIIFSYVGWHVWFVVSLNRPANSVSGGDSFFVLFIAIFQVPKAGLGT